MKAKSWKAYVEAVWSLARFEVGLAQGLRKADHAFVRLENMVLLKTADQDLHAMQLMCSSFCCLRLQKLPQTNQETDVRVLAWSCISKSIIIIAPYNVL